MTLRVHRKDSGSITVSLVECPACGAELNNGTKPSAHLFNEHCPEDFGLTPLDGRRTVAATDGGEQQ